MTSPASISITRPITPIWRLISFDLDGTLVDTASEIAEAANGALAATGWPTRGIDEVTQRVGHGTRDLMARLLAEARGVSKASLAADEIDAILTHFKVQYGTLAGTKARAYDGWPAALAELQSAGIALACVTNKDFGFSVRILEATALAPFFGLVIGGDTLTHLKPHASVLQHVMSHFGARPEHTAHVGDSSTDVLAARNAGVVAWVVPWGYHGGEPIETTRPDRIFNSAAELVHHVIRAAHVSA